MQVHDWTRVTAGTFHAFHLAWTAELQRALNRGLLPDDHYALAEQVAGEIAPDLLTLRQRDVDSDDEPWRESSDGGVALATAPPRVAVTASLDENAIYALRQRRLVIRHRSGDRVVAFIEIVSPANKDRPGSVAAFVRKAVDAVHADLHLLVLDLLPPGPHDPQGMHAAIRSDLGGDYDYNPAKPLTLAAYRAADLPTAYVEPLAVGDELPEMPLFLTPERYVNVPLSETYDGAWQGVPRRWREVIAGRDSG